MTLRQIYLDEMKKSGASPEEIEDMTAKMKEQDFPADFKITDEDVTAEEEVFLRGMVRQLFVLPPFACDLLHTI